MKLRAAGTASVVNWMLQGRDGEAHQAVLSQREKAHERKVLWHAVDAAHVEAVTTYLFSLAAAEMETDRKHLTFDTKWTPVKLRDSII